MDISIKKDDGSIVFYHNIDIEAEYCVNAALLGVTPAFTIPAEAAELAEKVADAFMREAYALETGACMCTSLSQRVWSKNGQDKCRSCGHDCHNTRAHCGALR